MFKAFNWMFSEPETKRMFIKNCSVLFCIQTAFIIISGIAASMFLSGSINALYGIPLAILCSVLCLLTHLLTAGYFWELTSSITERKTDIISSDIYDGKVKLIEHIKIPGIRAGLIWRGLAACFAMLLLIAPAVLIFLSIFIYNKPHLMITFILVLILTIFFSPGLSWNYARNNSIFSVFNYYTAGALLEKEPGRYFWNSLLLFICWLSYGIIAYVIGQLIGCPDKDSISNIFELFKFLITAFILYIPVLYFLHVKAFLVGTVGSADDMLN